MRRNSKKLRKCSSSYYASQEDTTDLISWILVKNTFFFLVNSLFESEKYICSQIVLFCKNVSLCTVQNNSKLHSKKLCSCVQIFWTYFLLFPNVTEILYWSTWKGTIHLHYARLTVVHADITFDVKINELEKSNWRLLTPPVISENMSYLQKHSDFQSLGYWVITRCQITQFY